MRDRFARNHTLRFRQRTLLVSLYRVVAAARKVSCLYKRPGPIFISIFYRGVAFLFAVTVAGTLHTTAIRGRVSDCVTAGDIPGLPHKGLCEN